ncbi:Type II secretion system F domain [Ignisphaera aggregans DSM 17230]|uniref:Type II secretion system F domain n=1 Tax=Ignisphaera aggregans (strain DSM 17230 / JCM 13409 / AQ1.S1) TaxID=583356 RepID=E0SRU7_IGNAA|nr:Type II secretion system F domain [Ignisphaera aggregans DSM 17230]
MSQERIRRVGRRVRPPTVGEIFTALSLTLFERWGRSLAKSFEFEKLFERAGLNVHPVKYASETIALTIFSAIFSIVGFVLVFLFIPLNIIQLILGLMIAVIIPIMVFVYRLTKPYIMISNRKNSVESELPFFMAYVSTMARGGYSLEKLIERVSQLKIFSGIRLEAQRIVTHMKMFGEDPITALDRVAMNHPSTRFRDVMLGYTTTLRSGGDVVHYLETRTREVFESRMNEIRALFGRLASYLEVYTVFGVIMAIAVFIFFAVSGALTAAQAARMSPEGLESIPIDITMPALFNFLVLPMMGLAILLVTHMTQPKTPVRFAKPYTTLVTYLPVSIAVSILILILAGGIDIFMGRLGLKQVEAALLAFLGGILTISIPTWIAYRKEVKGHKGLVKSTADFLRDLSEIRKTGLSPEKCIILLSARNYKNLTPVVSRAGAALSIGLSLEEALRKALRGVKEWFTIASFRFLTDSILVGGGSPEVIDTLARFTETLSELEEETRRRMRSQVFLPYFGSAMLSSMPIIILYMLLSIANIKLTAVAPLILILSLGAAINSFLMGIIAGKVSESTVAAGFKHATILTTVSTMISIATIMVLTR